MKQKATVVLVEGKLMARVVRPEACMKCRACDYGQKAETLLPLPAGTYNVGDEVELELARGRLSKASLWAYGVPLLGMLLALFLANRLDVSELWQALAAIAGVLLGFGILKALEPKFKEYAPVATPCSEKEG